MIVCLRLVKYSWLQHLFLPLCGPEKPACNLSDIPQEEITVNHKDLVQGGLWRANSAGAHMWHHPPGLVADQPIGHYSSSAPEVLTVAAAAVTIQAAVRGYLCRQRQHQLKSAAVKVQAKWVYRWRHLA